MKMKSNYPLFLPNVTKTYTSFANALTDENKRLSNTREALFYMIDKGYFDKIIIVDGSNQAVLSEKEIVQLANTGITVEQLLFQQDTELVKRFGKGHGEMQITNYMVKNSILAKEAGGFIKITPRYFLDNIDTIMPIIQDKSNVFYFYHPPLIRMKKSFACTIFYKTSIEFYKSFLEDSIHENTTEISGYTESVFYNRLISMNKSSVHIDFPHFSGIAGTTGKNISNQYYTYRNIFAKAGFMCYSFKNKN